MQLFQRREIWLPTMFGWLTLATLIGIGLLAFALNIHRYLAPNAPTPGAQLLIVEGWLGPEELDQALAIFKAGKYNKIITTGGPIDRWQQFIGISNYADLAANYFRQQGLSEDKLISVPSPASAQNRTYLSAASARQWSEKNVHGTLKVDLISSGIHARRSQLLYRMAFGSDSQIGVISALPSEYTPERWWLSSTGVKLMLSEIVGLTWAMCCFEPGEKGSHTETWGKY